MIPARVKTWEDQIKPFWHILNYISTSARKKKLLCFVFLKNAAKLFGVFEYQDGPLESFSAYPCPWPCWRGSLKTREPPPFNHPFTQTQAAMIAGAAERRVPERSAATALIPQHISRIRLALAETAAPDFWENGFWERVNLELWPEFCEQKHARKHQLGDAGFRMVADQSKACWMFGSAL